MNITGVRAANGHKYDKEIGGPSVIQAEAERANTAQHGGEMSQGDFTHAYRYLMGE